MKASEWNPLQEPNGFLFGTTTEWYPGQSSGSLVSATNGFPFGGSGFQSAREPELCASTTERLDTMQSLIVPSNKVNLSESDIEDWLYENPGEVDTGMGTIDRWLGRQYKLPSGIADLIGHNAFGIAVIEIKNVPITKAAVLQVCRYAVDLEQIAEFRDRFPRYGGAQVAVQRVLIGPSIDNQTFAETLACNVFYVQFKTNFYLTISRIEWPKDYRQELRHQFAVIASGEEWNDFGPMSHTNADGYPIARIDDEYGETGK
jgi:hypothetical protein